MIINRLNVGAYGIEPPADIFRLKWLCVLLCVSAATLRPCKRSPTLTGETLIIMSNINLIGKKLIHHLL